MIISAALFFAAAAVFIIAVLSDSSGDSIFTLLAVIGTLALVSFMAEVIVYVGMNPIQ
jgi:hypothetical protein